MISLYSISLQSSKQLNSYPKLIIQQKEYILLILDGLDVEAKGGADYTGVLPIDLQHNRCLT